MREWVLIVLSVVSQTADTSVFELSMGAFMKLAFGFNVAALAVFLGACSAQTSDTKDKDEGGQQAPASSSSPATSTPSTKSSTSSPPPDPSTVIAVGDCSTEASLKSAGGGAARTLVFVNNTSTSVTIYWIDYQGKRVAHAKLASGGIYEQGTYVNHPWLVADAKDQCKIVIPNTSAAGQRVCIGPADGTCTDPPTDATAYPDYDPKSFTSCKVAAATHGVSIGGFPRSQYRLDSTKSQITILFADFPDAEATKTPEEAYQLVAGAADTFKSLSYGKFEYAMNPVYKWYRLSKSLSEYVNHDDPEGRRGPVQGYIEEVIALADPDVDFSSTDEVVIITNPDVQLLDIGPAHPRSPGYGFTADGHEILNAVTSGYDLNGWGSIWLNHEATHTLGLPDLYAYVAQDPSNRYDNMRFAGQYSYMAYNGFDGNAPELTAWERWVLGWLTDDQMTCWNPFRDGEVTALLTPIVAAGGSKAIVVPLSDSKVAVVESRRRGGLDQNLHKEGALVYVVDGGLATGHGPLQVIPSDTNDPKFLQAPRSPGEYATFGGLRFEVLTSDSSGDTVRVSIE